jgi:Na+-transporting NADH:ubiquinone oxidoreductase subunit NqrA
VRRSLAASNNAHLRVLPIIVTSKMKSEIAPDVEAAERLGILILTQEDLGRAVDRTLVQPNADTLYMEAEHAVGAARAKYQITAAMPGQQT